MNHAFTSKTGAPKTDEADRLIAEINTLKQLRPNSVFLKLSLALTILYLIFVWTAHFFFGQNVHNLVPNFTTESVGFSEYLDRIGQFFSNSLPYSSNQNHSFVDSATWVWSLLREHAFEAAAITLCIALLAVLLAACLGFTGALLQISARRQNLTQELAVTSRGKQALKGLLSILSHIWNTLLIVMRAVPELIWAFILLSLLGPTPWTAILALGIHNTGILGRLSRELIEDAYYPANTPLRNIGATHAQLIFVSILPAVLQKFLVHGFYRWEACLRDAVIVGMLGLPTLGYWIFQEAWPKFRYDEMMLYIILSLFLVLGVNFLSQTTRHFLKAEP